MGWKSSTNRTIRLPQLSNGPKRHGGVGSSVVFVALSDRGVVVDQTVLQLLHLVIGTTLHVHKSVIGLREGSQQLVEFDLQREESTALCVLDDEHHDERDRRSNRRELVLQGGREARDRDRRDRNDD
jgi:hypothetical protein